MSDDYVSSRTPEGPLGFCPLCNSHCRIEPSPESGDATCPSCGVLVWIDSTEAELPSFSRRRLSQLGQAARSRTLCCEEWSASLREIVGIKGPLSLEALRKFELQFAVSLPASLSDALMTQDGGRILGTEVDVYPVNRCVNLTDGVWRTLPLPWLKEPRSRYRMICIGKAPGGSVVLDYRRSDTTPGVCVLDHIFDGELRAEFDSFDRFIEATKV